MFRLTPLIILSLLFQTSPQRGKPSDIPIDSGTCAQITISTSRCGGDEVLETVTPTQQGRSGTSRSSGTVSGPSKTYLPYDKIMVGPNGQACIGTGYYEEGTPHPRPVQGPSLGDEGPGNSSSLYSTAPPCPPEPRRLGEPAPLETPSMVARRYWEDISLPMPRPEVAPGRAITGKLAYLETNGETRHVYTNNTIFGPLEIVATGAYMVDWGDGETSGPHLFEGKPWPDGRITHEYQDVGTYNIVVTERWTAQWRLGGQSGVLRTLQTEGRIEDFPVEQNRR